MLSHPMIFGAGGGGGGGGGRNYMMGGGANAAGGPVITGRVGGPGGGAYMMGGAGLSQPGGRSRGSPVSDANPFAPGGPHILQEILSNIVGMRFAGDGMQHIQFIPPEMQVRE